MAWVDRLRARAFSGLLSAPDAVVRRLAGPPPTARGQSPDLRLWWVCWLAAQLDRDVPRSVARLRRDYATSAAVLAGAPPAGVAVREHALAGPGGGALPARVFSPPGPSWGGILYLHGGGWVIGDLDTHAPVCARLCADTGAVVVAVDYRLAPEHPFPAAWEDVADAWAALAADPAALGIDGPLLVAGDSAGATLATWLGHAGRPRPAFQWLLYPSTDPLGAWPSHDDFASGLFLTRRRKQWFHHQVYPDPTSAGDPRARPLAADVAGAAPAAVVVAGMDVLRDEGVAYAALLAAAGVPAELIELPDQVHGFVNLMGGVPSCAAAWREAVAPVRRFLDGGRPGAAQ